VRWVFVKLSGVGHSPCRLAARIVCQPAPTLDAAAAGPGSAVGTLTRDLREPTFGATANLVHVPETYFVLVWVKVRGCKSKGEATVALQSTVEVARAGAPPQGRALPVIPSSSRSRLAGWRTWAPAYLYILPCVAGTLLFILVPIIAVFLLGFFSWDLIGSPQFIGLGNYREIFTSSLFWSSLTTTCEYVVMTVVPLVLLSLGLALLLRKKFPGAGVFRTIAVLPWLATPVAIGVIWEWIFDPQNGVVNHVLAFFGIPGPAWLSSFTLALPTVAFVTVWQFLGYNMLFFLAGLQGVPSSMYEACELDGASAFQSFWHVTLPFLRPTMLFVIVIDMISSFQVFDTVYVMTNGGPGYATTVLNFTIYQHGFEFLQMGYASALSLVLFVIILIVTVLEFLYFRRRVVYDMS
jgi:multiple sugar transport system permease protein